jgi:dTDP-glucose 4,6-dehydratase
VLDVILVTGSLGVLGQPLVSELWVRGHEVFGTDLRHSRAEADTFMRADVADYRQLERVFDACKPDAVFHLAGEFGRHNGELHYREVWETNVIGTRNVLELCKIYDARLLHASTSEIYGELEHPLLSEELSDSVPLHQPNEYALSKWANEIQILNFQRRYGIDAVRLRFFNVYGPGEDYHPYRSVVALFCHRALNGLPWVVYEGYHRTFMYIDDFTPTLANVLECGRSGEVYNIGGEDYRSVSELSDIVLYEAGADPELVSYLPEDVHNVKSKRPDNSKARRDLGHDPQIELEEGVPKTLEWMRSRHGSEEEALQGRR